MADAFLLSERDKRVLQELLDQQRQQRRNPSNRPNIPDELGQTPEVYVARTPRGGIPAISPGVGTGTGTGTGTGSGPWGPDQLIGVQCEVFNLRQYHVTMNLTDAGFTRVLYNLSSTPIQEYTWVYAIRDKWGTWFAVPANGPPSSSSLTVEQTSGGVPVTNVTELEFNSSYFAVSGTTPNATVTFLPSSVALTVQQSSGGTPVDPTYLIAFNTTQGFVVTSGGTTTADVTISSAGATTTGVITSSTQTIGGVKTFNANVIVNGTNGVSLGGATGGTGVSTFESIFSGSTRVGCTIFTVNSSTSRNVSLKLYLNDPNSTLGPSGSVGSSFVFSSGGGLAGDVLIAVGSNYGQYGTDTVGNIFTAGICTTIGSGGNMPYSPSTPTNWAGTPPSTVSDALDRLAAWINSNSTVFTTLGITTQP